MSPFVFRGSRYFDGALPCFPPELLRWSILLVLLWQRVPGTWALKGQCNRYPLVICYILVLKMAIYSWFTHSKWWFSTVMLVYQRVDPGGIKLPVMAFYFVNADSPVDFGGSFGTKKCLFFLKGTFATHWTWREHFLDCVTMDLLDGSREMHRNPT